MEEISYVILLGEGQGVLDPHELHKLVPGLLGGFSHSLTLSFVGSIVLSLSLSFSFSTCCWSLYLFMHSFTHLFTIHISLGDFTPFTLSLHSYSSFAFGLGRGNKLMKNNHCFVGCRDY
jgi:hypothetical protein